MKEITVETDHYVLELLSLGASIKSLRTPDSEGVFENITLSYDDESDYVLNPKFLGATVGPYAGRIHPPKVELNQTTYELEANFMNHANLHSGSDNITRHNFDVTIEEDRIRFTTSQRERTSRFPGDMTFEVLYICNKRGFDVRFTVNTTNDALANLTNHTHFNLSGDAKRSVMDHTLEIPANQYLDLDEMFIGKRIEDVDGTPFDFRVEKPIHKGVNPLKSSPQKGIDHPFILDGDTVTLKDYESGRYLQVKTDYDALVVYSNNLPSDRPLEGGKPDTDHLAVCLEAQHVPNDIHMTNDAPSIIRDGEKKTNTIAYRFGTLPL